MNPPPSQFKAHQPSLIPVCQLTPTLPPPNHPFPLSFGPVPSPSATNFRCQPFALYCYALLAPTCCSSQSAPHVGTPPQFHVLSSHFFSSSLSFSLPSPPFPFPFSFLFLKSWLLGSILLICHWWWQNQFHWLTLCRPLSDNCNMANLHCDIVI